jgi:hypothetical protein
VSFTDIQSESVMSVATTMHLHVIRVNAVEIERMLMQQIYKVVQFAHRSACLHAFRVLCQMHGVFWFRVKNA